MLRWVSKRLLWITCVGLKERLKGKNEKFDVEGKVLFVTAV